MKKLLSVICIMLVTMSVAACGKSNDSGNTNATSYKDVKVSEIESAVAAQIGENYYATTEIEAQYLKETYGISSEMYSEFVGKIPMISVNCDTFIIVKANEGRAEEVEKLFNDTKTSLIENSMQYPMNIAKIQNSRVVRYGNYVAFIQLGGDASFNAADEEAEKKAVEAENQKAEDAILSVIK